MGLANRVVPKGKALESAIDVAKQIASFPQVRKKFWSYWQPQKKYTIDAQEFILIVRNAC